MYRNGLVYVVTIGDNIYYVSDSQERAVKYLEERGYQFDYEDELGYYFVNKLYARPAIVSSRFKVEDWLGLWGNPYANPLANPLANPWA